MRLVLFAAACVLAAAPLFASDVAVNTDARAIVAQQLELKAAVEAGSGNFKDLEPAKRAEMLERQGRVLAMLEGREQSTELSQQQQLNLFNELEAISAIVNQAEDERMVCERVRPVGTNRTTRVCKTVAQRRAERGNIEDTFGNRNQMCTGDCDKPQGSW